MTRAEERLLLKLAQHILKVHFTDDPIKIGTNGLGMKLGLAKQRKDGFHYLTPLGRRLMKEEI